MDQPNEMLEGAPLIAPSSTDHPLHVPDYLVVFYGVWCAGAAVVLKVAKPRQRTNLRHVLPHICRLPAVTKAAESRG